MNLYDWARRAKIGERLRYHSGLLGHLPEALAEDGGRASSEGLVFLAQRRLSDGVCAYEATRITPHCAKLLGLTRPAPLSRGAFTQSYGVRTPA